jgi:uncharacterized protein YndB with AHSA1/START domain
MTGSQPPDPRLDLVLERIVDVPRELVWKAWTDPELLKKWFTPAPWTTTQCEIDLRPGGAFRTIMRSPEGQEFDGTSCYLEIVENEKLVWTNALEPGYRPARQSLEAGEGDFAFTATIVLEPHGTGTKYIATAIHRKEADREKHEQMGFHDGWGAALDQLVAMVKTL